MKRVRIKKGFTIVETILVLSISSLFAVGMMAGWSININRQRYNDALNTLKSDIQGIFNEVENPTNAREANVRCVDDGTNVRVIRDGSGSDARGTTNCVLLGRVVRLGDNISDRSGVSGDLMAWSQNNIVVADIVGLDINTSSACGGPCNDHAAALRATKMSFDVDSPNNKTIEVQWSNNFKSITDNRNGRLFSHTVSTKNSSHTINEFLIVRSPLDNTVLAFATPSGSVSTVSISDPMYRGYINFILSQNNIITESKKLAICVRNEGASRSLAGEAIYGRNRVIRIGGSAASVEIAPLDGGVGTGSMSCGNGAGFGDVIFEGSSL